MGLETAGVTVATDDEGYLVDPDAWSPEIAEHLSRQEALNLSSEHWKVIDFMRTFYDEHRIAADARFVVKYLSNELGYGRKAQKRLFELFPYGYVKQACKIAGMKRPRAWSTG